jgi:hypothetical protein
MPDTEAPAGRTRKTSQPIQPMDLFIGSWSEDRTVFTVKTSVPGSTAPRDIKAILKKLGEGNYDTIMGRTGTLAYHTEKKDTFSV